VATLSTEGLTTSRTHPMHAIASADQLIATACERTGLSARLDALFLEALSQLVRSINREATLTAEGAPAANERLLRVIMNRLRFAADLERAPQILSEPLLAPLIISGLPRVGSTKLHRQLAEGGDFQSLLFWQGFNPAPLLGITAAGEDPRIAAAVAFLAWRSRSNLPSSACAAGRPPTCSTSMGSTCIRSRSRA
jgi:hypothetical protein